MKFLKEIFKLTEGTNDFSKGDKVTIHSKIDAHNGEEGTVVAVEPQSRSSSFIGGDKVIFKVKVAGGKVYAYGRDEIKKSVNEGRYYKSDKDRFKEEEMKHELGGETEGRPRRSRGTGRSPYVTKDEDRTYLNVPFAEKDEAKKMKARWDGDKKKWYHAKGNTDDAAKKRWPAK